jgi:hypothetical protein
MQAESDPVIQTHALHVFETACCALWDASSMLVGGGRLTHSGNKATCEKIDYSCLLPGGGGEGGAEAGRRQTGTHGTAGDSNRGSDRGGGRDRRKRQHRGYLMVI